MDGWDWEHDENTGPNHSGGYDDMAVTISAVELAAALRLGDSAEETAEVARLLAYATEAVNNHVETAPDVVHNEAVRRIVWISIRSCPKLARGDAYG